MSDELYRRKPYTYQLLMPLTDAVSRTERAAAAVTQGPCSRHLWYSIRAQTYVGVNGRPDVCVFDDTLELEARPVEWTSGVVDLVESEAIFHDELHDKYPSNSIVVRDSQHAIVALVGRGSEVYPGGPGPSERDASVAEVYRVSRRARRRRSCAGCR